MQIRTQQRLETIDHPKKKAWMLPFLKRLADILITLPGLTLLLPLFALIAIWIKRDSRGPVFYRGPRVGKGGKFFHILKFRTMFERPESYDGPRVTVKNDARVTEAGRWLRETKLNELPQLINVLRGDMSLVGPRPEDPEIVAQWPKDVREEILSVRPGITSPSSVQFRNEEDLLIGSRVMEKYIEEITPTKLRLDQLYVRNLSFLLDLDTLFWTLMLLLLRLKTYSPPEDLLFIGPIHRLFGRYLNWFAVDTLITFIAIGLAALYYGGLKPLRVGWPEGVVAGIIFALIFSISGALARVQGIYWNRAGLSDALDLVTPVVVSTLLAILLNEIWGELRQGPKFPNRVIVLGAGLAFAGFFLARFRWFFIDWLVYRWGRWSRTAKAGRERVLIIGGGATGQYVAWMLANQDHPGAFYVTGFVDDNLYLQGRRIKGSKVIGRCEDIPRLVAEYDIGTLIFAIHRISPERRRRILDLCGRTSSDIVKVPNLIGTLTALADQRQKEEAGREDSGEQIDPVTFSWSGIPPGLVDTWLKALSDKASEGDYSGIESQVHSLREWIRSTEGMPEIAWGVRVPKEKSGEPAESGEAHRGSD